MDLTPEQLKRKNAIAKLAQEAAREIDQAGRGLNIVMGQCASNTIDIKTVQILNVCMAYLNNAATAILEAIAGDEIQETQKPGTGLVLPTSAL